jgi:hypothetical protein
MEMMYALGLVAFVVAMVTILTRLQGNECTGQCRQGRLPCNCKPRYQEADSEGGETD